MIDNTRCDRLHVKRTIAFAFTRSVVCAGHDGVERHAEGKRGLDDASGCDVLWRAARRSALSFQIMLGFGSIRVYIMILRYVSASVRCSIPVAFVVGAPVATVSYHAPYYGRLAWSLENKSEPPRIRATKPVSHSELHLLYYNEVLLQALRVHFDLPGALALARYADKCFNRWPVTARVQQLKFTAPARLRLLGV